MTRKEQLIEYLNNQTGPVEIVFEDGIQVFENLKRFLKLVRMRFNENLYYRPLGQIVTWGPDVFVEEPVVEEAIIEEEAFEEVFVEEPVVEEPIIEEEVVVVEEEIFVEPIEEEIFIEEQTEQIEQTEQTEEKQNGEE